MAVRRGCTKARPARQIQRDWEVAFATNLGKGVDDLVKALYSHDVTRDP